jgi:hypothetical protein
MTLADIYALVEIKADHDKIERRNKALASAIPKIEKDGSKSLAQLGMVALGGLGGTDVNWFVETIHDEDQGFTLMSNEFELQVLALASLDLVVQQSDALKKQKQFLTVLRAAATLAFGVHPQLEHRKLHPGFKKAALDASTKAATVIETQARNVRARGNATTLAQIDLSSLPAAPDSTLPEALKKVLNGMHATFAQAINGIHRENMADREEVDILWWLQTGFSKRMDKPLSGVDANSVWIEIAEDAAALVNLPPAWATIYVIDTVIRKFVPKPEENLKPGDFLDVKLQKPAVSITANSYPMLFPTLIAVNGKLDQSAWTGQTGLRNTIKLSMSDWTVWHYKQRILDRMLNEAFHVR